MKNLPLVILALLALLISCSKQFLEYDNRLTITAFSTSFDTKASETAFEAGDKIGVFLENSHGNNALYETVDGSTWRGYDGIAKVNTGEKATAYYPYSQTATNQNAIEISGNVDFMITSATPITLVNNKASVALHFKHIFSKLSVDIKMPEEIAGVKTWSLDSVVAKNVFRKATVNLADGKITGLTDKGDLKAFGNEIIVIPPQTAQKIKLVFKMANGAFDSLAYNAPVTFESGKKTTLNAVSNADLYFTSFLDLKSGEAQTDLPLSFYVAPGRTWTLTSSAPWLTFSATTGVGAATVKVNVQANSAYPLKPRQATITLKDDKPSFASPQTVMQNYVRIPTVEIAGTNWLMANLTASYQGQTSGFTVESTPQGLGFFWKWGSKFAYNRNNDANPSGHWGSGASNYNLGSATQPTTPSGGYDYANASAIWAPGGPVGDPCKELGANYRTPTQTQLAALVAADKLNSSYQGTPGWFFGPSAASCNNSTLKADCIFLPMAGHRYCAGGELLNVGNEGGYWSSSVNNSSHGWHLYFLSSGGILPEYSGWRGHGLSVRCVQE